ncbi:MAG: hypothetical protein JWM11_1910 [Planctomycetaceae bacterium]|nr:hypothetical protein [Planctomycetaceae bacterium]
MSSNTHLGGLSLNDPLLQDLGWMQFASGLAKFVTIGEFPDTRSKSHDLRICAAISAVGWVLLPVDDQKGRRHLSTVIDAPILSDDEDASPEVS